MKGFFENDWLKEGVLKGSNKYESDINIIVKDFIGKGYKVEWRF